MSQATVSFQYSLNDGQTPKILLLGNGLERYSNQKSWEELLKVITHSHSIAAPFIQEPPESASGTDRKLFDKRLEEFKKIPFPLQYILLSSPSLDKIPRPKIERNNEKQKLKEAISKLSCRSNRFLKQLPSLQADHILTTNYSYCIESGFDFNFSTDKERRKYLRYTSPKKEKAYRLHTCYQDPSKNSSAIWHIHGEAAITGSIVLGHDRYGRLISEIVQELKPEIDMTVSLVSLNSWPKLFLFGDIYVLGFSFDPSEFDLWWLLQRKQNETKGSGQVYFYEISPPEGFELSTNPKIMLLRALGVQLLDMGLSWADPRESKEVYMDFYQRALDNIKQKIAASK